MSKPISQSRKKIEARFILRKKSAILVEIIDSKGNPQRASLPADAYTIESNGTVLLTEEEFYMGIPFGIPWEVLLHDFSVKAEDLAIQLRRNGIWTGDDVYKNPKGVQGAILSSIRMSISTINEIAKSNLMKEE